MIVTAMLAAVFLVSSIYNHDAERHSDAGKDTVIGGSVLNSDAGETFTMTGQVLTKQMHLGGGGFIWIPEGLDYVQISYTVDGYESYVHTNEQGIFVVEGIPQGSTVILTEVYLCWYIEGTYVEDPRFLYSMYHFDIKKFDELIQTKFENVTNDITVDTIYMDMLAWNGYGPYPCRCDGGGFTGSSPKVEPIDRQRYTGSPITPPVVVTLDGIELILGVDFTVTYDNNVNVGAATATIAFMGSLEGKIYIMPFEIYSSNGDGGGLANEIIATMVLIPLILGGVIAFWMRP